MDKFVQELLYKGKFNNDFPLDAFPILIDFAFEVENDTIKSYLNDYLLKKKIYKFSGWFHFKRLFTDNVDNKILDAISKSFSSIDESKRIDIFNAIGLEKCMYIFEHENFNIIHEDWLVEFLQNLIELNQIFIILTKYIQWGFVSQYVRQDFIESIKCNCNITDITLKNMADLLINLLSNESITPSLYYPRKQIIKKISLKIEKNTSSSILYTPTKAILPTSYCIKHQMLSTDTIITGWKLIGILSNEETVVDVRQNILSNGETFNLKCVEYFDHFRLEANNEQRRSINWYKNIDLILYGVEIY